MRSAAMTLAAMVGAASAAPASAHEMEAFDAGRVSFAGVTEYVVRNTFSEPITVRARVFDPDLGTTATDVPVPDSWWRSNWPSDEVELAPGAEARMKVQLRYLGRFSVCSTVRTASLDTEVCGLAIHRYGDPRPEITFDDLAEIER